MSILTHLQDTNIRDSIQQLDGEVSSRPALFKTDGVNLTYAVDVRIPSEDPTGSSWHWELAGDNTTWVCVLGPPGDGPTPGQDQILYNVPIAVGVRDVVYAEIGAAVTLRRNGTGRFEVIGFSKRKPGSHIRIAVNLDTGSAAPAQDVALRTRLLTLGELGSTAFGGGFGTLALGSYGVFRGTTLITVRV